MPTADALHKLLIDELRDAYDAEKQLTKALRGMSRSAISDEVREAFDTHLEETNGHIETLEEIFESLEMKPRGKHCAGIAGIIAEGSEHSAEADEDVRDLVLIAGARRAEHYEMAMYMILVDLATAVGNEDIANQFQEILEEEVASEEALAELAQSLAAIVDEEEDTESEDEDSEDAEPVGTGSRSARGGTNSRKARR